jgi:hypothetical protein
MTTGAQAIRTPTPGLPRRKSKKPRMGAANVGMRPTHQAIAAPRACLPDRRQK